MPCAVLVIFHFISSSSNQNVACVHQSIPCVSRGVSSGCRQRNNLGEKVSHRLCRAAGTAEEPGHLCFLAYGRVWFGESQAAAAADGLCRWQPLQARDPDFFLCPHPRGVCKAGYRVCSLQDLSLLPFTPLFAEGGSRC